MSSGNMLVCQNYSFLVFEEIVVIVGKRTKNVYIQRDEVLFFHISRKVHSEDIQRVRFLKNRYSSDS